MPVNLTFYTLAERMPEDDQSIIYVNQDRFNQNWGLLYGTIEKAWVVVDVNGNPTGTSIHWNADEPCPDDCIVELRITDEAGTMTVDDDMLWAPTDELEEQIFGGK